MLYKHPDGFRLLLVDTRQKIIFQLCLDRMIPVDGTCRIDRMNLSVQCYREVQQEVGIMPPHCDNTNRPGIRNSTNLMIFTMMIEPPRTDRYVVFSRQPLVSAFHSPLVLCIMSPCPTNRATSLFRRPNRTRCRSSGYREPFRRRSSLPHVSALIISRAVS